MNPKVFVYAIGSSEKALEQVVGTLLPDVYVSSQLGDLGNENYDLLIDTTPVYGISTVVHDLKNLKLTAPPIVPLSNIGTLVVDIVREVSKL
jgi:hypothetical protein